MMSVRLIKAWSSLDKQELLACHITFPCRRGCVTAKVRSRTTDGLILKIAKNVKFGEIDHYGACPSVYKPFKHSILCFYISSKWCKVRYFASKVSSIVSRKWRLFKVLNLLFVDYLESHDQCKLGCFAARQLFVITPEGDNLLREIFFHDRQCFDQYKRPFIEWIDMPEISRLSNGTTCGRSTEPRLDRNSNSKTTARREGQVGQYQLPYNTCFTVSSPDNCLDNCFTSKIVSCASNFYYYRSVTRAMIMRNNPFRLASITQMLLLIGNIEMNPGPPKIITVNCRGLSSKVKLLSTIGKLRKECKTNEQSIVFLQETHLDNSDLIANIWTGTTVIKSFFSNSQRGTIIILQGDFKVNSLICDSEGRFCIVNVVNEQFLGSNSTMTLVNIYAPNNHKESLGFFSRIFDTIESLNNSLANDVSPEIILAGDFNFVFDEDIDCQNRNVSKDERALAKYVSGKLYELELWDLVQSSQEVSNYTWRREAIRSRIDYVFGTNAIAGKVNSFYCKWQLVKTDHAAIVVELSQSSKLFTGRSYPKLSFGDIKEIKDREYIRSVIKDAIENCLHEWTPHNRLEYVKLMVRSSVMNIRSKRNSDINNLDQLKEELNNIEQLPSLGATEISRSMEIRQQIAKTEETIEELLRIRSGIKWREEGERSTKFFLNLINSKARTGNAHKGFIDNNGTLLSENKEITEHAKKFYADLYEERKVNTEDNIFSNCPSLDDNNQQLMGSQITLQELRNTLKSCKDSTPGLDGIPYSFYKLYSDLLLPLVLESWNYGLQIGTLAPSHRQSCITIIPKAGKDPRLVRNWRPITVASCDLKIITKALSNRMAKVLPSIIFDSQMAYVPGRDINFNNRLLSYALENANEDDNVIVSFDAEKAFDSVSHEYLRIILERYKFPVSFINYFNLIYKNNSSIVQVNGHLSNAFAINRGVKQGDALSCSLFVLAVDPLIRNIEANNKIRPMYINDSNVKLKTLAYADDIAVLTKSNGSVKEIFKEYERLFHCSGLRLNADKTEILQLNGNVSSNSFNVRYLGQEISINPVEKIKVCGNHLLLDKKERYKLNITAKINSLKNILNNWSRRHLTLNGKMMIIKCHALSQITFVSQFQNITMNDIISERRQ